MEAGGDKPKRAHKKATSGRKAKKKKEKQVGKVDRHNPKAHTFSGGVQSVRKRVVYQLEKQSKKEHAPKVDKTPDVPPPFVVVVQGPPGVGKSTLINSLVKHYARQNLLKLRGPVTLVSGRQRRLTIVECPQETSAMLDLAKVADLVLVLIDASFGFELETFEFINILQVHGFPRIIGVLTHLDSFHDNKQLRKTKKTMKQRFWSEIFEGAKLFYLSGLQYGKYHRLEVQNLARFIAVQKAAILSWRTSHPYTLVLRWEDQTDPTAQEGAPRRLDLFGYVYGGRLREGGTIHMAGVGDFPIAGLKSLPDPCLPPADVESERRKAKSSALGLKEKPKKHNALRTLAERHRNVYAPGSDVGSITVDSEAMYIQLPEHDVGFTERDGEAKSEAQLPEAVRLVRALQGSDASSLGRSAKSSDLRLLGDATIQLPENGGEPGSGAESARKRRLVPPGGAALTLSNGNAEEGDGEENSDDDDDEEDEDEEEEAEEAEDGTDAEDKAQHRQRVLDRARERFQRAPRLEEVVYGAPTFGRANKAAKGAALQTGGNDVRQLPSDHAQIALFEDDDDDGADQEEGGIEASSSSAGLLGNVGDNDAVDTTRMSVLPSEASPWDENRKEALKARKFITGGWSSAEEDEEGDDDRPPKSKSGKAAGEAHADADGVAASGEETAPDGTTGEGAEAGDNNTLHEAFSDSVPIATFVRIRLEDVPAACVAELRRERPIILGGLLPGETNMGMMQVRVKRHRWYPKLLKSGDSMLVSVGWRRFQTVPTFSLEDRGEKRMRYLKYTLEHAHCTMTSYGPLVPPNTGVIAFRSWDKVNHFRICGTGVVLEFAPNFQILKKLKLCGEPYKIFKNTAFIRNMFNSDLEVNKYMQSKIQTVSGIRGQIKKAEGTRGDFRATFEDRILMSDLTVCKCWVSVEPKRFYHPVVDVGAWRPARLIGELRAAAGVAVPSNRDSEYGKQIKRPNRKFNPLRIPKALEAALPYKTKPKLDRKNKKNPLRQKTAIVSSEREKAVNSLLLRLHTVKKEKQRIRHAASAKKKAVKEKREQFIQDKRDANKFSDRKKRYIKQGQEEQERRKRMRLE